VATESRSERFEDLDLWPADRAIAAMLDGQVEAVAAVKARIAELSAAAEASASRLLEPSSRLVYVGAGTSGRVAVQDGVELAPTYDWPTSRLVYAMAGGERALVTSVEGAEDDADAGRDAMVRANVRRHDVVIGVAASGRTPFTVAALEHARAASALTIAIASNAGTPLLEVAEHAVLLDTGAEVVAGSTRMKAGTAQKIALNLLSTAIMVRLGRVYRGRMVSMRVSNKKLHSRAVAMVADLAGTDTAAAAAALAAANNEIKLAVLLALGVARDQAVTALERAGGNLRAALGQVAPPRSDPK
jgi:N-acetylmuramic acid 6-phosphate etherase